MKSTIGSATASTISLLSLAVESVLAAPTLSQRQTTNIPSHSNVDVQTSLLGTTWPWRVYKSSSFTPPNMTISANGEELAPGFIFMTPSGIFSANASKEGGGYIMTSDGEMVYGNDDNGVTDFRMQEYNGQSYLTYWSGFNTNGLNIGHGYGQVNFLDDEYNTFTIINPDLGLNRGGDNSTGNIDIHEHQVTPQGTILCTAYNNTMADLTSVGGSKNGYIVDSVATEIDIATGEVLFEWKASEHVPFTSATKTILSPPVSGTSSRPWDWFHMNSIDKVGENYLINSRPCFEMFMVAPNGTILWSFDGETGGSFGAPPLNGQFSWQHHVRAHNVTDTGIDISIFDNHNAIEEPNLIPTRQLVYHLDLPASKSVTPVLTRMIQTSSDPEYVDSQGSYIPDLPNGNQFVGLGQIAISREYGPATDGSDLRWEAQFGGKNQVQSYRGFKQVWHATPASWDPSLVVEEGNVYVSWNGATDVDSWNVYTGSSQGSLTQVGNAVKMGFETVFAVPSGAQYVQVAAVQGGSEVRKSNVAATS